tara:strand:- start:507 stop:842 length:336 start_codon:yes stop_codon:yes gene_type:complete
LSNSFSLLNKLIFFSVIKTDQIHHVCDIYGLKLFNRRRALGDSNLLVIELFPIWQKRVLSEIHSSLISSFITGKILIISFSLKSTRIFDPIASEVSIDSDVLSSHGLYLKA